MSNKVFIVAEMSANHGGSLDKALETVHAIKETGADAMKIQTYRADTITLDCDREDFMVGTNSLWTGQKLFDLYSKAYTPWEWHEAIFQEAKKIGLICFSSPFDKTAVDLLESLGNPIYKIASPEITDIPLIEYAASKMKPIVISTGIAIPEDIELAIDTCRKVGNNDITLLKCTTAYPAPIEDANLLTMVDMRKRFGVNVGLSDHTQGTDVAVGAAALGACMIEKHFIVDRAWGGPDSSFSMDQKEFTEMVKSVRNVEKALGSVTYPEIPDDIKGRRYARSLYVSKNIRKGEIISEDNIKSVRPGYGLHPKYYSGILGKRVNHDLTAGERLSLDMIE
ncbi:MAG: pseudaminic acid synthase [Muribaculaceae bacterium]|nr:pseudaminic acid synthase [Muribaculaceae bacterium]